MAAMAVARMENLRGRNVGLRGQGALEKFKVPDKLFRSAAVIHGMSMLALGQYFGRVPRRWSAQSMALSPVIHDCRRVNVTHTHEAAFVSLMLQGQYRETAGQRSYCFDRFTAIYHPPGVEHQDFIGAAGVRLLMFEFRPEVFEGAEVNRAAVRSMRDLSGSRAAWELLSLYRHASEEETDFEWRAMQVAAGIVNVAAKVPRERASLDRARQYLHAHFRERIMMRDLAAAAGVHPVYLGQMFQREMGESVTGYITRMRVRAAAEALCRSDTALASLAVEHGFYDQSHFQRAFKSLVGVTPTAFRSSLTAEEF